MRAGRWNYLTRVYDPYILPEGSTTFEFDLDKEISCASCGKKIIFGDSYTSRRIHTEMGMGYSVCTECYDQDWISEKHHKNMESD